MLVSLVLIGFRLAAGARESLALGQELPSGGQLIETTDGAVFLLEKGQPDNQAVLFAHGTAAWSALWLPTLEAVALEGFYAQAFDMPPFGWSEHPEGDYSRERQSDRVIALLEALNNRPIVVAHSFGAGPVAEAVMQRPDLVSGLVIVSGAIALGRHDPPSEVPFYLENRASRQFIASATVSNPLLTRAFLRSFLHVKSAASAETTELLQEPMRRAGYTQAVADWLPTLLVPPLTALSTRPENWRRLEVPIGLIWGAEDTVTPLAQAQELHSLVPQAHFQVLQNVGHIPQIEDPASFQAVLGSILKSISDPLLDEAES